MGPGPVSRKYAPAGMLSQVRAPDSCSSWTKLIRWLRYRVVACSNRAGPTILVF